MIKWALGIEYKKHGFMCVYRNKKHSYWIFKQSNRDSLTYIKQYGHTFYKIFIFGYGIEIIKYTKELL